MTRKQTNQWVKITLINAFMLALNVISFGAHLIIITLGGAS